MKQQWRCHRERGRGSEYNFAVAYGEGEQNTRRIVVKRKKMCLSSMNLSGCYESKQLASRATLPAICGQDTRLLTTVFFFALSFFFPLCFPSCSQWFPFHRITLQVLGNKLKGRCLVIAAPRKGRRVCGCVGVLALQWLLTDWILWFSASQCISWEWITQDSVHPTLLHTWSNT